MKKLNLVFTMAVALVLSSAGFAQASSSARVDQQRQAKSTQPSHQELMTPEAMVDHLATELNLTDDQIAKIKPMAEDVYKQMEQVHQDSSLSEQERREKTKGIHENALGQMRTILTPDQLKKLDEMMSSHAHHGDGAHSHHGQDQGSSPQQHQ